MNYPRYLNNTHERELQDYRSQIRTAVSRYPYHDTIEQVAENVEHIARQAEFDLIPLNLIGIPVQIDVGNGVYVIDGNGQVGIIDKEVAREP